ncbi:MFS transporter [Sulfolobus sp. SCGC AB-777_L09]|nr:MFS transporter [Sulfolobus sp. SCGC AB-777_L09]
MRDYIHATIASTFAWAGNIYDLLLLTYVYSYFEKVYSLSILDFSILFALGLIGRVIGGSYFGNIADKIGRKPILLIGTAGYSTSQLLLALSPNVLLLYVFRLLEGIFMGAQWTAGTVLAYEKAPVSLKGIITGIVQSGYGIGYAMTGVAYILLNNDPRLFLITGSIPLILIPYILIGIKEGNREGEYRAKVNIRDYLPILLRSTAGMAGMFIAYFSVFGNYTIFAEGYLRMSSYSLGLLMTLANIGLAISFILFGRLADFMDKRKLIYIGALALLLSLPLSISVFTNDLLSQIGISIYAFFTGFWPLMALLLVDSVPLEVRGFLSGLAYNIGGFVGGIANIILGFIATLGIYELVNSIDILGFASITVVLVSVITWPKTKRAVVNSI